MQQLCTSEEATFALERGGQSGKWQVYIEDKAGLNGIGMERRRKKLQVPIEGRALLSDLSSGRSRRSMCSSVEQ